MMQTSISKQTLKRLPDYLSYLRQPEVQQTPYVSASKIAKALQLGEIQVRKDLAAVSDKGKPKVGYNTLMLTEDLEGVLGCANANEAVLIGVGSLGMALLSYDGFADYGLSVVAGFDVDASKIGTQVSGKTIFSIDELHMLCKRMHIKIGVITVPAQHAQHVCDILVSAGISAIWNFAPIRLVTPDTVFVKSENMAASLAVISNHLSENTQEEE